MPKPMLVAAFAALIWIAGPAAAAGSIADAQVGDRTTGQTLPMYRHQGRWWAAATPGNRCAIAVANRGGARVLTVISVDGVDAVSGETAASDLAGYVLERGQRAQITGWRKRAWRVAAFEFVALSDPHAVRTGTSAQSALRSSARSRNRFRSHLVANGVFPAPVLPPNPFPGAQLGVVPDPPR